MLSSTRSHDAIRPSSFSVLARRSMVQNMGRLISWPTSPPRPRGTLAHGTLCGLRPSRRTVMPAAFMVISTPEAPVFVNISSWKSRTVNSSAVDSGPSRRKPSIETSKTSAVLVRRTASLPSVRTAIRVSRSSTTVCARAWPGSSTQASGRAVSGSPADPASTAGADVTRETAASRQVSTMPSMVETTPERVGSEYTVRRLSARAVHNFTPHSITQAVIRQEKWAIAGSSRPVGIVSRKGPIGPLPGSTRVNERITVQRAVRYPFDLTHPDQRFVDLALKGLYARAQGQRRPVGVGATLGHGGQTHSLYPEGVS